MENMLQKGLPFRPLACVANALNSALFTQLNFPRFSVIYKDLSVYSNVAATSLATIESLWCAYKRNPVVTLVLEKVVNHLSGLSAYKSVT